MSSMEVMAITAASCSDGIRNQDESGIDCGGPTNVCGILCGAGAGCNTVDDCAVGYNLCYDNICQIVPTTYGNGIKDGYEKGIDCGGAITYAGCGLNNPCSYNTDCFSGFCHTTWKVCVSLHNNSITDGPETGTDCGGFFSISATNLAVALADGFATLPELFDYRSMTISFWYEFDAASSWSTGSRVLWKTGYDDCDTVNGSGLKILVYSTNITVSWSTNCVTGGGKPVVIVPNDYQWHHYTFVIDGARDVVSMYRDGALISRQSNFTSGVPPSQRVLATGDAITYIGGGNGTLYVGDTTILMSHVQVYDRALTSLQVKQAYAAVNGGKLGAISPIAYYPFNRNSALDQLTANEATLHNTCQMSAIPLSSYFCPPETPTPNLCTDSRSCIQSNDCTSSYCTYGRCTARCENNIMDGSETALDCGGSCGGCQYAFCVANSTCWSRSCDAASTASCLQASCSDGIMNGLETAVDCGGNKSAVTNETCSRCLYGQTCYSPSDCDMTNGYTCYQGKCAHHCWNGVRDFDETGIDCGSHACGACYNEYCDFDSPFYLATFVPASTASDADPYGLHSSGGYYDNGHIGCHRGACADNLCSQPLSCYDGILNGDETDVDCGGSVCAKCGLTRICETATDCATSVGGLARICYLHTATNPTKTTCQTTCVNGIMDGSEVDVDCGATAGCGFCPLSFTCTILGDCNTTAGVSCPALYRTCTACSNGIKDGLETGVDCGSFCTSKCAVGVGCNVDYDCSTSSCFNNICVNNTCSNGVKDGNETGVDCGGGVCGGCAENGACYSSDDCTAGLRCHTSLNQCKKLCSDGVKDSTETALDCGYSAITRGAWTGTGTAKTNLSVSADTARMTISAWVRFPTAGGTTERGIVGNIQATSISAAPYGGWSIYRTSSTFRLGYRINSDKSSSAFGVVTGTQTSLGATWNFITVVVGANDQELMAGDSLYMAYRVRLYVNSKLEATSMRMLHKRTLRPDVPLHISGRFLGDTASTSLLYGSIDQLAIWLNHAMNAREIRGIYRMEPSRVRPLGLQLFNVAVGGRPPTYFWPFDSPDPTLERMNGTVQMIDVGTTAAYFNYTEKSTVDYECRNLCAKSATCVNDTDCGLTWSAQTFNMKQMTCPYGRCADRISTCFNQIQDSGELGIDCGGPCGECPGSSCDGTDFPSSYYLPQCASDICEVPSLLCGNFSCSDGIANGDELGLDCGGSQCTNQNCLAYRGVGQTCYNNAMCISGYCNSQTCQATHCTSGKMDADETGIDCGGATCGLCAGQACTSSAQCQSNECNTILGVCYAAASCFDGRKSTIIGETDIDCGGACPKCFAGQACSSYLDCRDQYCSNGVCSTSYLANCTDGILNGGESEIDCSYAGTTGSTCLLCYHQNCTSASQCKSGVCYNGICESTCYNGILDIGETDIDCGGVCANLTLCNVTQACVTGTDCLTGNCYQSTCRLTYGCASGTKDGNETDVDCGGSRFGSGCLPCDIGSACTNYTDCVTNACHSLVCATACPVGQYETGNACATCTGGTFTNTNGSLSCASCPAGYRSSSGASICSACAAGESSGIGSPNCLTCTAGRYSNATGSPNCRPCQPGTTSSAEALTSCYNCANGTTSILGGLCQSCTIGYYAIGGDPACSACPRGMFGNSTGASQCYNCLPGKYNNVTANTNTSCIPCSAGSYSSFGAALCTPCDMGYYQGSSGQVSCTLCPTGLVATTTGSSACVACPLGYKGDVDGITCIACPAGFASPGGVACNPCASGYYTSSSGSAVCIQCGAGSYANATTGASQCIPCSASTYSSTAGSTTCSVCDGTVGQYQLSSGASYCSQCASFLYYNGSACVTALGSTVDPTSTTTSITATTAIVYYSPVSTTSSVYYAVQLVSVASGLVVWPVVSTTARNFTFFGLTPATTYSCVVLTMLTGTAIGGPGSTRTTYSFTTLTLTPSITSFVAAPNTAGAFGVGATMTITFDSATNQPAGSNGALPCTFSTDLAPTLSGAWSSATVFVLTVTVSNGLNAPSIASLKVSFAGITAATGTSISATVTSPPLSGTWFARIAPYLSVYSSTVTMYRQQSLTYMPVSMIVPGDKVASKTNNRLIISITEGTASLQISTSLTSAALAGTATLSGNTLNLTGTPYTLGRMLPYMYVSSAASTFTGRVTLLMTLYNTTTTTVGSVTTIGTAAVVDTAVVYYNVIAINRAPQIVANLVSAAVYLDTWSSMASALSLAIYDADSSLAPDQPLRLQVLSSDRTLLSRSSAPATNNGTWVRFIDVYGTWTTLQTALASIYMRTTLRTDGVMELVDQIQVTVDDLGNGAPPASMGPQSSQIATVTIPVTPSCVGAAPPVILSAVLEGGLSTIAVTLDRTVAIGPTLNCSTLVATATYALLGTTPSCVMTSGTQLLIALGADATIVPGNVMLFTSSIVRCTGATTTNNVALIILGATVEALTAAPVVSLIAPFTIPSCSSLLIRASARGLGGRVASWNWFVNGQYFADPTIDVAAGYYANLNFTASFVSGFATNQNLSFGVTVTNFMGVSSSATVWISATVTPVPDLRSVGSLSRVMGHYNELNLRVLLRDSDCYDLTTAPSCVWTGVTVGTGVSLGIVGNGTAMTMAARSLTPATSYEFMVTCDVPNGHPISLTYAVAVAARASPVAWIDGGQSRLFCSRGSTYYAFSYVTLDGSKAIDNDPVTSSSVLTYTWSCRTAFDSLSCLNASSPTVAVLTMPTTSTLSIASSSFFTNAYIFTLTVTTSDGRTATSREITVTIWPCLSTSIPLTSISMAIPDKVTPLWYAPASSIAVSAQSPVKLTSTLLNSGWFSTTWLTYLWTITGGELNSAGTVSSTVVYTSTDISLNLQPIVGANYLTPGATYKITLTVTYGAGLITQPPSSSTSILITAAFPPAFGHVFVNLNSTSVLSTLQVSGPGFELRSPPSLLGIAGSGVAAINGEQLAYRYYYVSSGSTVMVAFPSPDTELDFTDLPPGTNGVLYVGVRAYDGYGACLQMTQPVYIEWSDMSTASQVLTAFDAGLVTKTSSSAQELLALVQGVASVVSTLSTNYTVDTVGNTEQAAQLTILNQAVSSISSVLTVSAAADVSLLLDTFRTVTGSTNFQLVSTTATSTSLVTMLGSLISQVVATLDINVITNYIANQRNMISMALVNAKAITVPIVSRRLLAVSQPTRDSIDAIYAQVYALLTSMSTSLISVQGETHAFEQSGLSVTVTRTRLALRSASLTYTSNVTIAATSSTAAITVIFGATTWPTSASFQRNYTYGSTWLVDVSAIAAYPNPYGVVDTTYLVTDFVSPGVAIGTLLAPTSTQSDTAPFLPTTSYNYIELPFNSSRIYTGGGYRAFCVMWNNITWITTNIITSLSPTTPGYYRCAFAANTTYSGPYALVATAAVPPTIASIQLVSSRIAVVVTFDQMTNQASGTVTNCSLLFAAATMANLSINSASPVCTWNTTTNSAGTTVSTLVITSFNGILYPLTFEWLGGVARSADGFSSLDAAQSIASSRALTTSLTVPTPIVNGRSTYSWCENVTFDGSQSYGGLGVDLKYVWSVSWPNGTVIQSTIGYGSVGSKYQPDMSSLLMTYPSAQTYIARVVLINWVGTSTAATDYSYSFVRTFNPVPVITVTPGTEVIRARDVALNLTATAVASPCSSTSSVLIASHRWNVSSAPMTVTIADSSSLAASLYFYPFTFVPGSYVFLYTAVDTDGYQSSAPVSVTITNTTAPSRVSAQFDDTCTRVNVAYDSNTNRAGNNNCAMLLPSTMIALLGTGYACFWSTASTLAIVLGTDYNVRTTMNITSGIVLSQDGYSAPESSTASLTILAPSTEPNVTAIITGQASIGACRGITLDGSSSTGQAGVPSLYTYKWTTTSPTPTDLMANITAAITAAELIANASGTPMRVLSLASASIPANYSYGFILTTTNWRGVSAVSSTFTVTKVDDVVLEIYTSEAADRTVTRRDTVLTLVNYDQDALCGAVITAESYSWSQTAGPEIPVILGSTTKTLIISPYQMTSSTGVAGFYEFTVTVSLTLASGRILTDTTTTQWQCIPLPLLPAIAGSNRVVSLYLDTSNTTTTSRRLLASNSDVNFTLDASLSYDPDVLGNVARDDLTYSWNCSILSTGVACVFVAPLPDFTQKTLTITKAQLSDDLWSTLESSDALVFACTIGTTSDTRTSVAVVQIQTTLEYTPAVAIRSVTSNAAPVILSDGTTAMRISPSEMLTLRAYVSPITSTTQMLWACTSNNLELTSSVLLTPLNTANLVLAANVLNPGVVYTFQLMAKDPTYSNVTGYSTAVVITNAPPTSGSCIPSSASIRFNESVTISCYDWTDDAGDLPILYTYGFVTDAGLNTIIGQKQTATSITSFLPMGVEATGFIRQVYIDVSDQYGATVRTYINITVTPPSLSEILADPNGSLTGATDAFVSSIDDAVNGGDSNLLVSSVAAASSLLTYYASATSNSSAVYASNGIVADVLLGYLTANKSMELRLSMFNSILSFAGNDERPASTATVTESLSVINTLLGAPAELGISTDQTVNDTVADSEVRITLREAAGNLLYNLAYIAFSNPNVTLTPEIGGILVSGLDSIAQSSVADSSPVGTVYTNGTTALQREQMRSAERFSSTTVLITLGETKNLVVGQDPVEHTSTRMYMASQRQSLAGAAGGVSTPTTNPDLYTYNVTRYDPLTGRNVTSVETSTSPSFALPSDIFSSAVGPILGYNYTTGEDGNVTATPIYGTWPEQVDTALINYKDNLYQWREATVNDSTASASLSSLQGFTLYPHSDPDDTAIDDLDVDSTTTDIPSQVNILGLNESSPIMITIPLSSLTYLSIAECRFWNESALDGVGNWSTDGCSVYQRNDTYLVCACTHLTVFNSFLPVINIPSIPSASDLLAHPEGWITMICIWFVFAALVPLVVKHDKARYPIALSTYVEQHSQLVKTGTIVVEDEEKYHVGMTRAQMKKLYMDKLLENMREEHSWFAAFYRDPLTGYTSCEQLTMCFLIVLGSMAVAGFFFGVDDNGDIVERIKAAIFTALCMVPLGTIVNYLLTADPSKGAPFWFVQQRVAAAELQALGIKYQPGKESQVWAAELKKKEAAWKLEQKLAEAAAKNGVDVEQGHVNPSTNHMPAATGTAAAATAVVATAYPTAATLPHSSSSPSSAASPAANTKSLLNANAVDSTPAGAVASPAQVYRDGNSATDIVPVALPPRSPPMTRGTPTKFTFVDFKKDTAAPTPVSAPASVTSASSSSQSTPRVGGGANDSSVSHGGPRVHAPLPPPPVPPVAPAPADAQSSSASAPAPAPRLSITTGNEGKESKDQIVLTVASGDAAVAAAVTKKDKSSKDKDGGDKDGKKKKKSSKKKSSKKDHKKGFKKAKGRKDKGTGANATNTVIAQSPGGTITEQPLSPDPDAADEPQLLPRRPFPLCCLRQKPAKPKFEYRYTADIKLHEIRQDWNEAKWHQRTPPARIFGIVWTLLMMAASSFLIILWSTTFIDTYDPETGSYITQGWSVSTQWLVTSIASMIVDAIISQPITIAIKTVIFVFIIPRILIKFRGEEKKKEPASIEMVSTDDHKMAQSPNVVVSFSPPRSPEPVAPATIKPSGTDDHIIHDSRATDGVADDINHDTTAISFATLEVDANGTDDEDDVHHRHNAPVRQTSMSQHEENAFHDIHARNLGMMPSDDEGSGSGGSGSGSGSGSDGEGDTSSDDGAPVAVATIPTEMKRAPSKRQPQQATSATAAARATGPNYSVTDGVGTRVVSSAGTSAIVGALDTLLR